MAKMAKMEQRNYDLELLRMNFMNEISEIATGAWEIQKSAVAEIQLGQMSETQKKQHHENINEIVLLTQRWWIEKQSELVSKMIDDYKTNSFFRQIAKQNENNLDTINENLKNIESMKKFLKELGKNKPRHQEIGNNTINDKFKVLGDMINRVFRDYKDDDYHPGEESISSLPLTMRVGLIDDLLTSYLSGDYRYDEKISDKYIQKYEYRMQYFSFLPMKFSDGADINPKIDLTHFKKYFECYCKFLTNLLKIEIVDETTLTAPSKKGGSKKTRKYKKIIINRKKSHINNK